MLSSSKCLFCSDPLSSRTSFTPVLLPSPLWEDPQSNLSPDPPSPSSYTPFHALLWPLHTWCSQQNGHPSSLTRFRPSSWPLLLCKGTHCPSDHAALKPHSYLWLWTPHLPRLLQMISRWGLSTPRRPACSPPPITPPDCFWGQRWVAGRKQPFSMSQSVGLTRNYKAHKGSLQLSALCSFVLPGFPRHLSLLGVQGSVLSSARKGFASFSGPLWPPSPRSNIVSLWPTLGENVHQQHL